jgi:hypothetical protein
MILYKKHVGNWIIRKAWEWGVWNWFRRNSAVLEGDLTHSAQLVRSANEAVMKFYEADQKAKNNVERTQPYSYQNGSVSLIMWSKLIGMQWLIKKII